MVPESIPIDRRHRRRQETIAEVIDHAVEIMAEEGVAGLSLGEIARRMGIRPPSLYVYYPSKNALYDALFKRGWELLLQTVRDYDEEPPTAGDLASSLTGLSQRFVRWAIENPAYAQLLFWRPVPGFHPSDEAYAPAIQLYDLALERFRAWHERGLIRSDADIEQVHRQWTIITSGVISQQLSNAPDEPFQHGRSTSQVPALAAMFASHYATPRRGRGSKTKTDQSERAHARQR